jgi:hypothetical protein
LVFIYDSDKLKPFSVPEIQTPNLSQSAWLVFIYDFDKLKPFSVSEIQTPNLSLVGIYVWFWQTQTDFGVWNSATLFIFISDNGWYIYIWQFETSVSHVSMNTANMHFSINDFRMVSRLDKNAVFLQSLCKKIVFRFAKMKSSHFLLFFLIFAEKKIVWNYWK